MPSIVSRWTINSTFASKVFFVKVIVVVQYSAKIDWIQNYVKMLSLSEVCVRVQYVCVCMYTCLWASPLARVTWK